MDREVRPRTDFERVYEKIFDEETGLEVRVDGLEERTAFIDTLKSIIKILRWPAAVVATAILSQLGSWLVTLLRGGP